MATDTNQSDKKFISQIKLSNNEVYDINTPYSITFKDGNNGSTIDEWKGDKNITVVIPTVSDLLQNPIEFVGTVNERGEITYTNSGHTAKVGDLLYFLNDCTFDTKPCEAGDMAICTDIKENIPQWSVISGEHQISISDGLSSEGDTKTAVIGVNNGTNVLDIEGKKLALKLNMSEIESSLGKGGTEGVTSTGTATTTVGDVYIKVVEDTTTTATGTCTVGLNDKTVTLANGLRLATSVTLPTISGGTLASGVKNESVIPCSVSGGVLSKTTIGAQSGDFVDGVDISLSLSDNNTGNLTRILYDSTLTPSTNNGETFVKGIHEKVTGETANFITATFDKATYISSIGDYISGITGGSFKVNNVEVTDLLYGLDGEITDNSAGNGVVYDVEVSSPTSVLSNATVENGVLSFASNTMSITPKYKSFKKATYTPVSPTAGVAPTTGTLSKKEYVFNTGHDTLTTYGITPTYKYLDIAEDITYGSYNVSNIGVSIPTKSVVVNVNSGVLPTITGGNVEYFGDADNEKTIGTVSDSLIGQATASVSVNKYKLSTSNTASSNNGGDGIITVGAAGDVDTTVTVNGNINLSAYYCSK